MPQVVGRRWNNPQLGTLTQTWFVPLQAMYCTGGIRCESASAFLRRTAKPAAVYQLKGGIHRYLEAFPDGGYFRGKNFVFDGRVAVAPSEHVEGRVDAKNCASKESVVGRCALCCSPHDVYDHDNGRCHRCRALVLVCPTCLQQVLHVLRRPEMEHNGPDKAKQNVQFRPLLFCLKCRDWQQLVQDTQRSNGAFGLSALQKRAAELTVEAEDASMVCGGPCAGKVFCHQQIVVEFVCFKYPH